MNRSRAGRALLLLALSVALAGGTVEAGRRRQRDSGVGQERLVVSLGLAYTCAWLCDSRGAPQSRGLSSMLLVRVHA